MGNVARVFWRDLKRLGRTPAAWSVVLFLIVLPSLYTWFNVAAFWNPYDNTGNLRVCVVNEDAGVDDELLGRLDVGDQLVAQLRENDQLAWAFVSRDEAMAEVDAGRAYAAFVIPETFSADIATLTTGDFRQPTLEYHVNEKTGPVSPKITDTGASSLDTTINDTFFATVSSTVASMLDERLGEARVQFESARTQASGRLDKAIASVHEAQQAIDGFGASVDAARADVEAAKGALAAAQSRADAAASSIKEASALVEQANSGLSSVSSKVSSALSQSSADMAKALSQTEVAMAQTAAAIEAARAALGIPSDGGGLATPDYSDVIALLEQLKAVADDGQKARIDQAIEALQQAPAPGRDWSELAQALDEAAAAVAGSSSSADSLVMKALQNANEYHEAINGTAIPAISAALASIASVSGNVSAAIASQQLVAEQAQAVLDELDSTLTTTANALGKTKGVLADLEGDLASVKTDLSSLASANALGELIGENGVDPEKIADFMMSPTQVKREELYPINAYGSAMAPLFINLTLWIGVFMLMVIIRLEVDDEDVENLTIAQRTFGRGLLLAVIAALQAVVCCSGCLVMGVQAASPALFVLTAVIASLAYLGIQYTLSTTLQHVGKAICIILVFVQIPGATGLYPIEMTPEFFHVIYPLFPFTYGINAIRETICGFYGSTWASCIGVLVAFLAGFVVIGTIARPYMTNLNRMFAREIEESDIINGEAIQLPARRYRMSQVIRAFSDHDEYREAIGRRVARFMALYPKLKQGALVVGVAFLVLATAVLAAAGVEKVVVLTTWLAWFALVVAYLIVVEYLRDYLSHLVSLVGMSDDDMRALYEKRNRFTRVQPIHRLTGLPADEDADADTACDNAPVADGEASDE